MTEEIAVRQATPLTTEQLKYLSGTDFVQPGMRNNIPAILACVAMGRELGIGDMVALRSIHIIDGKATFSAELMVQLVRRAGHSIMGEVAEGSASVKGRRADNGDEMSVTWTMAMAERAGLAAKQNWKKYPEAMLWARAVSQLCRMLFADCFAGATYTTEELGDADTGADGVPEPEEGYDGMFPPKDQPEPSMGASASGDVVISEAQRKRLRAIQTRCKVSDDELKALVTEVSGVGSSKLIPLRTYDALVAALEARGTPQFEIPEGAQP